MRESLGRVLVVRGIVTGHAQGGGSDRYLEFFRGGREVELRCFDPGRLLRHGLIERQLPLGYARATADLGRRDSPAGVNGTFAEDVVVHI